MAEDREKKEMREKVEVGVERKEGEEEERRREYEELMNVPWLVKKNVQRKLPCCEPHVLTLLPVAN